MTAPINVLDLDGWSRRSCGGGTPGRAASTRSCGGMSRKEQLRAVFATKGRRGEQLLAGWIAWARRSRLPEFVKLARTIKRFQQLIWNTIHKHGVSNARSEATNTHIRALTKRAYGYHSPEALIAMAMLTRGGLNLELPGRK